MKLGHVIVQSVKTRTCCNEDLVRDGLMFARGTLNKEGCFSAEEVGIGAAPAGTEARTKI